MSANYVSLPWLGYSIPKVAYRDQHRPSSSPARIAMCIKIDLDPMLLTFCRPVSFGSKAID